MVRRHGKSLLPHRIALPSPSRRGPGSVQPRSPARLRHACRVPWGPRQEGERTAGRTAATVGMVEVRHDHAARDLVPIATTTASRRFWAALAAGRGPVRPGASRNPAGAVRLPRGAPRFSRHASQGRREPRRQGRAAALQRRSARKGRGAMRQPHALKPVPSHRPLPVPPRRRHSLPRARAPGSSSIPSPQCSNRIAAARHASSLPPVERGFAGRAGP